MSVVACDIARKQLEGDVDNFPYVSTMGICFIKRDGGSVLVTLAP